MGMLLCPGPKKAHGQLAMGFKVAANSVSMDNFSDFSGGFDIGLFCSVGKKTYVQPELCYSFRSTDFLNIVGEFRENYAMRQHFLDIPLLIGYHFINLCNFKMHIVVGPRVAVLLNNHLLEAATVREMASHIQWGGQLGVGIDIWRLSLDARYDIAADKTTTNQSRFRLQNMFVVSLGVKLLK